jgi:hypothetical protein
VSQGRFTSRRGFLLGGAGAVAAVAAGVEAGLLPGKVRLQKAVGQLPSGGRTGHHGDAFGGSLYLHCFLADAVQRGTPAFAVASVDGGDHDYWHPRRTGDPAAMVIEEFLPLLAAHNLNTARIGLLGWSMGGYGALYLAGRLSTARTAVAIAESPAIWHQAGQSVEGAFDDANDFNQHAIFGRLGLLEGIALRLDCGHRDGFAPVTQDLRAALTPTPAGGIEPGGHDATYWRSQAAAQLRFAGNQLARANAR